MRKRTKILASVLIGLVSACNTSFASSYTNAVSGVLTSYNARLEATAIYKPNDYLELSKCYSDCKDELSKLKATNELEFKFNELLLEYSNARLKMFEAKSKGVDDKQLKIECDAINKEITKLYEMLF